jgi:hypothetical protein
MKDYELDHNTLHQGQLRNLYIASLHNKLSKGECSCGRTCICKKAEEQGVKLGQR